MRTVAITLWVVLFPAYVGRGHDLRVRAAQLLRVLQRDDRPALPAPRLPRAVRGNAGFERAGALAQAPDHHHDALEELREAVRDRRDSRRRWASSPRSSRPARRRPCADRTRTARPRRPQPNAKKPDRLRVRPCSRFFVEHALERPELDVAGVVRDLAARAVARLHEAHVGAGEVRRGRVSSNCFTATRVAPDRLARVGIAGCEAASARPSDAPPGVRAPLSRHYTRLTRGT